MPLTRQQLWRRVIADGGGRAGEVLADAGTDVGATVAEIDLAAVSRARHRVPSLTHDRDFEGP